LQQQRGGEAVSVAVEKMETYFRPIHPEKYLDARYWNRSSKPEALRGAEARAGACPCS
jgi:hypothetical protein